MKKTVVIADDNAAFVNSLVDYLSKNDYEIVGTAYDGLEASATIEKTSPDYALIDIVMPELDGFGVLSSLNLSKLEKRPTIIMMSQLCADGFISKSLRMGASYFFAKPFAFDELKRYLDECEAVETVETTQPEIETKRSTTKLLDEKIANIFISVGIPAHIKGYQFLREAIKMAVETPSIINSITKKLYPSIAKQFETSPSKVERAIRHAIEVSWNRGKIENINNIFGIKVYSANEKPTNGEFIALVADKMLLEGAATK
ncbi:MAG: sporulation transcription factor Spo0A [Christensenellales bacterium]